MTWTFSDGHPKVLRACNFLSQYYFYNIFLQKSCRYSLQTLTKFEATKTGSGVGFLRLTAVWRVTGSISAAVSCLIYVSEQRLVIEPTRMAVTYRFDSMSCTRSRCCIFRIGFSLMASYLVLHVCKMRYGIISLLWWTQTFVVRLTWHL